MDSKKDTSNEDDKIALSSSNEGESLEFSPTEPQTISPDKPKESEEPTNPAIASDPSMAKVTNAITDGKPLPTKHHPFKAMWERINIYLLVFILIIVVSAAAIVAVFFRSRTDTGKSPADNITQQPLSAEALQELASNGVQVGDPKQVLSIQSNSVFAGTVLVKGELQVAGGLKIGSGALDVPSVNIGGTAIVNDLQTQTLAVAGNAAIRGQLTVQQNLSVNGSGSFNGAVTTPQLTAGRLQLSGDLVLTRHLVAGGAIPGRTNGGALGSGGTSSISGSDTAGSISINTGSGSGAGCFVTVNFAQAFNSTPHVIVTPVGSAAADINYYINRSAGSFSVCSSNAAPSNSTFGYDYHVLE